MPKTFEQLWNNNFPNKVPIPHVFKFYFSESWFRIHSLPKSKRYADTKAEELLLLERQNQIITDCLGLYTPVYLVTGNYFIPDYSLSEYDVRKSISYKLTQSSTLHLSQIDPEYFDDGDKNNCYFIPLYTQMVWEPNQHNDLLLKIANDEIEAFFISFEKKLIVAPYDGGIDFIIEDRNLKNSLYEKYHSWSSSRNDGL